MKNYSIHLNNWENKGDNFYKKVFISEFGDLFREKNKRVLEIGFGYGNFLKTLNLIGFNDVDGVEIDKHLFEHVKSFNLKYHLYNQDAFDFLKTNKKKYDLIFLIDVLEHIPTDKLLKFLGLLYKNLDLGGICVIRTVNAESILTGNFMRYIDSTHVNAFTRFSITPLLEETGFSNVLIKKQRFHKGLVFIPIRIVRSCIETIAKILYLFYFGENALKSIQTPNIIIYAKK